MSWIDSYLAQTEGIMSPPLFRKWAAISTLASTLERKVWVRTAGSDLFPNLYVLLVSPPGVGKSESIWRSADLIGRLSNHHVAPSSVSSASLIDSLDEASRHIQRPAGSVPAVVGFNALYVASSELGVLLPGSGYDAEFMSTLTDLYDAKAYTQKRRTRNLAIEIKKPLLNILAGTQPAYLRNTFPEGAWDQGFASRMIMVYSGEQPEIDIFGEEQPWADVSKNLLTHLKKIGQLYGQMQFTESAKNILRNWFKEGAPPKPDAPKLVGYNARRVLHTLKLCQVASANVRTDLIIDEAETLCAIDWLIEAEHYMPEIFKAMTQTSHSRLIEDTWYFLRQAYIKGKKQPVPAPRIINFLSAQTPAHNVARVLEMMEAGGLLQRTMVKVGNKTIDAFVPLVKQEL